MAMQPPSHGNNVFPFYVNDLYLGGLVELQQLQPPQYYQQQPPQNQQQWQGNVVPIINSHVHASNVLISPALAALFEKQMQETYELINIQNNQIKFMLQHHTEQQVAAFRSMEIYSQQIITRKNEEIAKVVKKKLDLENLLRKLEAEKRELKGIALERGAMVITLHTKLEEEKKRVRMLVENDAESSCGEKEELRAEKRVRRENNVFCSECKTNTLGVLFLPCRHLSSCKACNALLQTCPICGIAKKGIIEIQNSI